MPSNLDFDYDLWANKKWASFCAAHPEHERFAEVLLHILNAQWVWVRRIIIDQKLELSLPEKPTVATESAFVLMSSLWNQVEPVVSPTAEIDYNNLAGERFSNSYSEIQRHVVNHGTYHRGHLRGLAEAAGIDTFPESDYILKVRRDLGPDR